MVSIVHGTTPPLTLGAWEETYTDSPVEGSKYVAFGLTLTLSVVDTTNITTSVVADSNFYLYE
jgi:hypothetical protein